MQNTQPVRYLSIYAHYFPNIAVNMLTVVLVTIPKNMLNVKSSKN